MKKTFDRALARKPGKLIPFPTPPTPPQPDVRVEASTDTGLTIRVTVDEPPR